MSSNTPFPQLDREIASEELPRVLEAVYQDYHHPEYISPDPLEFLSEYPDKRDREVVGIIASSLALGRVTTIIGSVRSILDKLPHPAASVASFSPAKLTRMFTGFRHRFYNTHSLVEFLSGVGRVIVQHGSLNGCFINALNRSGGVLIHALSIFADEINRGGTARYPILPSPSKGSACKRLNLFLRWMIRKDMVDPGGWEGIPTSKLIVPLDTHMHQIGQILQLTSRKSADMRCALEITEGLARIDPEDPVRFDFSLTRLGIHPLLNYSRLFEE